MKKLSELSAEEQSNIFMDMISKVNNQTSNLIGKRFNQEDFGEVSVVFHSLYTAKYILVLADYFEISKEEALERFIGSVKSSMKGFVRKVN